MIKNNILVLSAGRRVELINAFKNSLKSLLPDSLVFAADANPLLSAACQVADHNFKLPYVSEQKYLSSLEELIEKQKIGLVIPTIDTELKILSKFQEKFKKNGVEIVISSEELVQKCRDKRQSGKLFLSLGINSPEIYSNDIPLPCFCKPYDGSCSSGAQKVSSLEVLNKLQLNEKNIFMELIPEHFKEYSLDAYYDKDSHLKCLVPRERIETRAGEISKGQTCKKYFYQNFKKHFEYLEGARGCLTIQVFYDYKTDQLKGIEINPRFGGGYPLSYAAGANYPEWLIKEYLLNQPLDFYEGWKEDLVMLRYDASIIKHA